MLRSDQTSRVFSIWAAWRQRTKRKRMHELNTVIAIAYLNCWHVPAKCMCRGPGYNLIFWRQHTTFIWHETYMPSMQQHNAFRRWTFRQSHNPIVIACMKVWIRLSLWSVGFLDGCSLQLACYAGCKLQPATCSNEFVINCLERQSFSALPHLYTTLTAFVTSSVLSHWHTPWSDT